MVNRELTFAEKKVRFNVLDKAIRTLNILLEKKLSKYISIIEEGKETEKDKEEIINIITFIQKEAFDLGKKSASVEMKIKIPPTNKAIIEVMKQGNKKIIDKMINDIKDKLKTKNFSDEGLNIVHRFFRGLGTIIVSGGLNLGREAIFEQYPEKIYAMQYSAILDDKTSNLCLSLDGLVVKPGSNDFYNFQPPNHYNCRSIRVEILDDEEFKPPITGIPKGIPKSPNLDDVTPMKAPIITDDSLSKDIVDEKIKEREEKLKKLEKDEKNIYRQEQHKKAIDLLKKGIK